MDYLLNNQDDYTTNLLLLNKSQELFKDKYAVSYAKLQEFIDITSNMKIVPLLAKKWIRVYDIYKTSFIPLNESKKLVEGTDEEKEKGKKMSDIIKTMCITALNDALEYTFEICNRIEQNFLKNLTDNKDNIPVNKVMYNKCYELFLKPLNCEKNIFEPTIINKIIIYAKSTPTFYLSKYWVNIKSAWENFNIARINYYVEKNKQNEKYYLDMANLYRSKCCIAINATSDVYMFVTKSIVNILNDKPLDDYIIKPDIQFNKEPRIWDLGKKSKKKKNKLGLEYSKDTTECFKSLFEAINEKVPEDLINNIIDIFVSSMEKNKDFLKKNNILWINAYNMFINTFCDNDIINYDKFKSSIISVINHNTILETERRSLNEIMIAVGDI